MTDENLSIASSRTVAGAQGLVGSTVGNRYQLRELIGFGPHAAVYCAVRTDIDKAVAVKLLVDPPDDDSEEGFLRAARVRAGLQHGAIARTYDVGRCSDGRCYAVTELLPGTTLEQRLASGGRLSPDEAAIVVHAVASALETAFERGIVHGNLKPRNVFLIRAPDGTIDVRLTDIGEASRVMVPRVRSSECITDSAARRLEVGPVPELPEMLRGVPEYMSPEQIRGERGDERSHVYALGALTYEMLCGKPPFVSGDVRALLTLHLTSPPLPILLRVPGLQIPLGIERVVATALSKDPTERQRSPAAFSSALLLALAGSRHSAADSTGNERHNGLRRAGRTTGHGVIALAILGASMVLAASGLAGKGPQSAAPSHANPVQTPSVAAPHSCEGLPAGIQPAEPVSASPSEGERTPVPQSGARLRVQAMPEPVVPRAVVQPPAAGPEAAPSAGLSGDFRLDDLKKPF